MRLIVLVAMVAVLVVAIVAVLEVVQVVQDAWLAMDTAIIVQLIMDVFLVLRVGTVIVAKVAKTVTKYA